MRATCYAVLLACAAIGAPRPLHGQAAPTAAALAGRVVVVDAGVASPIRRARVVVTAPSREVLITDTDTDGRYRLEGLRPGRYELDVVKAGFYIAANAANGVAAAGTTAQVEAGATATQDVVMERGAAIEGRIVYSNGEPAPDAVVEVRPFGRAGAAPASALQPVRSDDRGRFRVHSLPPGDYLVEAGPRSMLAPLGAPRASASGVGTFFPGVTRADQAKPVSVLPRQTTTGIDFTYFGPRPPTGPVSVAPPMAPQSATNRIAGRITRADNGEPIGGATVNVFPWTAPFNVGRATAFTDAQGRFAAAVPDGTYRVNVLADGFTDQRFGGTGEPTSGRRVEFAGGDSFARVDVAMPRPGAIEGRVRDEFGQPAPGVLIQLVQTKDGLGGVPRLAQVFGRFLPRPTDDTGAFRIFDVPPGNYQLLLLSGPFVRGTDDLGYAIAPHRGPGDGTEATTVRVNDGADTSGVEVAVLPARMSEVQGTVVTPDNAPVAETSVALLPLTGGDVRSPAAAFARTDADGVFVLRNVPEGAYAVQAQTPQSSGGTPLFGSSTFDVRGPATTIRVEVRPRATLRGRVVFEGEAPHPSLSNLFIYGEPANLISTPLQGYPWGPRWGNGNTFTIERVVGESAISATAHPDDWVMTRVTRAGADVTDAPIDLRRGDVDGLEITFKRVGASVSGAVTDGERPADMFSVVVFPADPEKLKWPSRLVKVGQPNQRGAYKVTGLPPGDYFAIALPEVPPGGPWWRPEWLQSLADKATRFSVQANDARTVGLRLTR